MRLAIALLLLSLSASAQDIWAHSARATAAAPGCTTVSDNFAGSALSANWTVNAGTFVIASNTYEASSGSNMGLAHWNANDYTSCPNQYSRSTVAAYNSSSSTSYIGPACRVQASGTSGYFVQVGENAYKLFVVNAGTFTQLGTTISATATVGDVIEIDCGYGLSATHIAVLRNGTPLNFGTGCTTTYCTDSTFSAGQPGISDYGQVGTVGNAGSTFAAGSL